MIGVGVSLRNLRNSVSSAALSQYAVLGLEPPLVLDFDEIYFRTGGTATDLVSAATHTRASSVTYVDADGILQTAAINEPRVGHHIWNGSAWVDEGYFHESEARTNLVTYSEDFTDASWVKDAAATANDAVSPDGTTNADYLSIGANGYIQHNFTHTIGQQYTISAWVKSYDGTDELFRFYGEDGNASGDFTATNEWQRFSYTYTATQTTGGDGITRPSTLVPALLHVYGAQVEAGSTPSSYIPTAGATVTRAADALTEVSPPWGSALSVNIKGTETFADENSATQKLIYDRRVDANNRITLALDTAGANTGKLTLTMANGGSSATISTTAELTPNINEPFNVAFVCTATELGIALNGTAETRVTHAVGLPDLSAEVAAFAGMGTRSLIREWADDLTDQGIAEASA